MRSAGQIYEEMVGSCNDTRTDEERDCQELMIALDGLMFECATCNWWCDISEQSEKAEQEPVCTACDND